MGGDTSRGEDSALSVLFSMESFNKSVTFVLGFLYGISVVLLICYLRWAILS